MTALWMYGVDVGSLDPLRFCGVRATKIERQGIRFTRVKALPPRRGLIVIPEHAFVVAATHLDVVELVTAGDWLVRRKKCAPADLVAYAAAARGPEAVRRAAASLIAR